MEEPRPRILVVDDEEDIVSIVSFNLRRAGYDVVESTSAPSALAMVGHGERLDLLLLDVMMPDMDGYELARRVRALGVATPIIFLTAKGAPSDMVRGFDLGADDYVGKPFSMEVLLARVKAVLRRTADTAQAARLTYDTLALDDDAKRATIDGHEVALTKTEYELLRLFLSRRSRVLSREELIATAWPDDVLVSERTVDVNITRLRKKLGRYAANIVTRQGFGYLFTE